MSCLRVALMMLVNLLLLGALITLNGCASIVRGRLPAGKMALNFSEWSETVAERAH